MTKDDFPYIHIKPGVVQWQINAHCKKEENGKFSWVIPSLRLYYSSDTLEAGQKRAHAMGQAFFQYWIKSSFREFVLEIHRLGFRANKHHDLTISELIRRKRAEGKFKSPDVLIPKEFLGSAPIVNSGKLELVD